MAPLPPLRDGGCALPICPFGRACHPLISDAPDCKCSPGRLRFWVVWASCPACASSNFNPHAPCGARLLPPVQSNWPKNFNPRAPCGARPFYDDQGVSQFVFQSTRPVWGATACATSALRTTLISIHAPRVGRDGCTPPPPPPRVPISIHAPRVGRDSSSTVEPPPPLDFNPRAPCGARRMSTACKMSERSFQSTRPVWGATRVPGTHFLDYAKFQSTRPVWGATANLTILPRQICTKGTKEFLLGRKTHGKKEK